MAIQAITDNDLYSFTISYFYMRNFPHAIGRYEFIDRNNTVYPKGFDVLLTHELYKLAELKLGSDEESFLRKELKTVPDYYFEWLRGFRFNPRGLTVTQDEEGHLSVSVLGTLYEKVFWEVAVLATISELYHEQIGDVPDLGYILHNTIRKAQLAKEAGLQFSDFGTRRRFSFAVHEFVLSTLKEYSGEALIGTSNVYLAMKYDLKPIGTMAHQVISTVGAFHGYRNANGITMDMWEDTFDGEFLVFLYDTYSSKPFEENFTKRRAKLWDGLRVDSGDNKIAFNTKYDLYEKHGVDQTTKSFTFSNNLKMEDAVDLHNFIGGKIKDKYGIGTSLVCDCGPGIKSSNIVMKLIGVCESRNSENWIKCVKLSDDLGKYTGDKDEVELCLKTIGLK